MINLQDIRYVRLGASSLEDSSRFAHDVLGLMPVGREGKFAYFKSDSRDHTLCYVEGDPAVTAVGFELADPTALDRAAAEIEAAGYPVRRGTTEDAELRRVREVIFTKDPSGNTVELVTRPHHNGVRYHGTRDAGITGFNHIGLKSNRLVEDEKFWTTLCSARVSDWIGDAALLRISKIHHSIALFPSTGVGVQHVNHQVATFDDVMRNWYFLQKRQVRIVFGPGRHATSGAMFLYFEGPDGMVYEYSCGVNEIDEQTWRPRQFPFTPESFCVWGSRPDIPEFRRNDD
jgi:2,3-dihydroxy-p-cumate/2,3-dihydroxybenzoate 3,4-dioxygenase